MSDDQLRAIPLPDAIIRLKARTAELQAARAAYEQARAAQLQAARVARRSGVPMSRIALAMGIGRSRAHALVGSEPQP